MNKPDKKLIIMYLTSLFHGLREYSPQGGRKRRKLDVSSFRYIEVGFVDPLLYLSHLKCFVHHLNSKALIYMYGNTKN